MKLDEMFNLSVATVATALTWLIGAWDTALIVLVLFMALDYITGVIREKIRNIVEIELQKYIDKNINNIDYITEFTVREYPLPVVEDLRQRTVDPFLHQNLQRFKCNLRRFLLVFAIFFHGYTFLIPAYASSSFT